MQLKKQRTDKIRFTSHSLPFNLGDCFFTFISIDDFPIAASSCLSFPNGKIAIESPPHSLCLLVRRTEEDTFP
jgi:hypothetical protein